MRTYRITIYIANDGDGFPVEIIKARNYAEAEDYAMKKAHKLSNYGYGAFLQGWRVEHIKKSK